MYPINIKIIIFKNKRREEKQKRIKKLTCRFFNRYLSMLKIKIIIDLRKCEQ